SGIDLRLAHSATTIAMERPGASGREAGIAREAVLVHEVKPLRDRRVDLLRGEVLSGDQVVREAPCALREVAGATAARQRELFAARSPECAEGCLFGLFLLGGQRDRMVVADVLAGLRCCIDELDVTGCGGCRRSSAEGRKCQQEDGGQRR